jgi:cell division protein ZapA (FtsZ GTPase activity inhibitor)
MDEIRNMTVIIGGRSYPLKVKESERDDLQEIVRQVNEKIKNFQLTYTNRDTQDSLAMTLLTYAVDLQKAHQNQAGKPLAEKVRNLNEVLDKLLQ